MRTAPIDPRDIAAVAARALTEPDHESRTYRLTGPEALTVAQQVRIVGEVLGQPVAFEEVTEAEARAGMSHYLPPDIVAALLAQARREGPWSVPLPTVADLTGIQPTTFRRWATDHAELFRE